MTDIVEKALLLLDLKKDTSYRIANATGITEATIGNYRNGKTKPTKANAIVILQYFSNFMTNEEEIEILGTTIEQLTSNKWNRGNVISVNKGVAIGKDNNGNIDNRQYYSDSPDVLRAQIDEKEHVLIEKDNILREKDAYIAELKETIKELKSAR